MEAFSVTVFWDEVFQVFAVCFFFSFKVIFSPKILSFSIKHSAILKLG